MEVIDRILELLEEKGITNSEFALGIQVSPSNVSDWKARRAKPSLDVFSRIASYLGVSADYLLGKTLIRAPFSQEEEEVDMLKREIEKLPVDRRSDVMRYIKFLSAHEEFAGELSAMLGAPAKTGAMLNNQHQ